MSPESPFRCHMLAALLGTALIASPLAVLPAAAQANNTASGNVQAQPDAGHSPDMGSLHGSYAPIVARVKPAVVTITSEMDLSETDNENGPQSPDFGNNPFSGNSPFDQFFRKFFGQNGIPFPPQQQPHGHFAEALGSGFIIDASGVIVTNNHVIAHSRKVTVTLDDGAKFPAKIVGHDAKTDLAVLRIQPDKQLPTVSWGDSTRLQVGDQVLALGNAFGLGITVTSGIVSARGRDLQSSPYNFVQIDAPINHGNSGGPLIDMDGQVVGINTAIYTPNGGSVGVGFAIPSTQARSVVAKLLKNGSIQHGYLGVEIQPLTQTMADALGLKDTNGALVAKIVQGSPAAKAGVKQGDVIVSFNGNEVNSSHDLARMASDTDPGTQAQITVLRQGQTKQLTITVGNSSAQNQSSARQEEDQNRQSPSMQGLDVPSIGLGLTDVTSQMRDQLNLDQGVSGAAVESVNPNEAAAASGIQEGDVIVSVNQSSVSSAQEAKQAISQAEQQGRKSVLLLIDRDGNQIFVAVPFNRS